METELKGQIPFIACQNQLSILVSGICLIFYSYEGL